MSQSSNVGRRRLLQIQQARSIKELNIGLISVQQWHESGHGRIVVSRAE